MKKFIAFIMCAALSVGFAGCGDKDSSSNQNNSSKAETPKETSSIVATTGSLKIDIVSTELTKDKNDADSVFVNIKFTNNTSKKQNFKYSVGIKAKQGENVLSPAIIAENDKYQPSFMTKNIEPGESLELKAAYVLKDKTTPIDVICKPSSGENKDEITKQLPLN